MRNFISPPSDRKEEEEKLNNCTIQHNETRSIDRLSYMGVDLLAKFHKFAFSCRWNVVIGWWFAVICRVIWSVVVCGVVVLFIRDSDCTQDDIERGEDIHRERTGDQHIQCHQQGSATSILRFHDPICCRINAAVASNKLTLCRRDKS